MFTCRFILRVLEYSIGLEQDQSDLSKDIQAKIDRAENIAQK